jgi:hypothetical protein
LLQRQLPLDARLIILFAIEVAERGVGFAVFVVLVIVVAVAAALEVLLDGDQRSVDVVKPTPR